MKIPRGNREDIPFGILPNEDVRVGDHIAYFWETEKEFEQGANFLLPGLKGRDHCVIFGHDDANRRVCEVLSRRGISVADCQSNDRLTIAGSGSTGKATLAALATIFQRAVDAGAPLIRLLGNIGWGKAGWPKEDDILLFEAKVTGAAKRFPAVVVCMYDVNTLSGRALINGGLGTHPITVCGNVMRVNSYYVQPLSKFADRVEQTTRPRGRRRERQE